MRLNYGDKTIDISVPEEEIKHLQQGNVFKIKYNEFNKIIGLNIIDPNTNIIKHVIPTIDDL